MMAANLRPTSSVLWRRRDTEGHDAAALFEEAERVRLTGTALFIEAGRPCHLAYEVVCDASWRTRHARVAGWCGADLVDLAIERDGTGVWRVNGVDQPAARGCEDVDLNITPATNTLSIRRLSMRVGETHVVRAAWLSWPNPRLVELTQRYRRIDASTLAYEADLEDGMFRANLVVDPAGLVLRYGSLWEAMSDSC